MEESEMIKDLDKFEDYFGRIYGEEFKGVNVVDTRRENAAELIEDLSEDKQIMMMTFNPDDAELFSEANIEEL